MANSVTAQLDTAYGVFQDLNRHTCIRVKIGVRYTEFIPMEAGALGIQKINSTEFAKTYEPLLNYSLQRAAEKYLFRSELQEVQPQAREHLRKILEYAGGTAPVYTLPTQPAKQPIESTKMARKQATQEVTEEVQDAPAPKAAKKVAKTAEKKAAKVGAPPAAAKRRAAVAEPEESSGRGRAKFSGQYKAEMKIKLLVKENPKREGSASYDRYELYRTAKTIGQFVEGGGKLADIKYDSEREFISVA